MRLKSRVTFPTSVPQLDNQTKIDLAKQNNMATLAQAPTHAFQTIGNNVMEENSAVLNNISHHVTVSKIKSQQVNFTSQISKQNSLPTNVVSPVQNGMASSKPYTTSQNHPPKIKVVNQSPAFCTPPTQNDTHDVKEEEKEEDIELEKVENSLNEKTDCPLAALESTNSELCKINNDKKSSQNVIPSKVNMSTPPKQPSFEYSSSPSSTTSSLNRENSLDYKDSTGVDLHEFMVKTLRENPRDRLMLLKLERDFTDFINDIQKGSYKYPPMTSYQRMLIHRVAAYFGLDHNVDSSGKSVIISKTPSSRCPETPFQSYCSREYTDEEISAVPKSILPRSASSDENATPPRYASPLSSIDQRFLMEEKRSRSIEEREEDYHQAKERIFSKDPLETLSNADSNSPVDGSEKVNRLLEHKMDSMLSEKEAAIAAVAAATGCKTTSSTKRFNDRKALGHLQFSHSPRQLVESYSPTTAATIAINPQTGSQPIVGADSSPVYYHPNYPQPHAAHVAYVPNTGHPYMQQQQQQHGQYVPVYYVSGSTTSNTGQPGSQYYMQQTPSGQVLYIPTQSTVEQQPSSASTVVLSPQQQISYHDYINQLSAMNINERHSSISTDENSLEKQQATSPTSPVDGVIPCASEFSTHARQVVYVQNEQPVQGTVYQQQANYPLQYYQNIHGGYPTYSINQYGQQEAGQYNPATVHSPVLSQRTPSPTVLQQQQQHYVSSQSVQNTRAVAQAHQIQSSHGVCRPRFISGIMPNPRPGTPMYIPVATPQGSMLVTGQYPGNVSVNASGYPMQSMYRTDKFSSESAEYKLDPREGRNVLNIGQNKALLQMQPTYQPSHAYLSHPQRFVSPSYGGQLIRPVVQQGRRYRPHRHATNNQQIRISRPNSNSSEADQKTVSHILEIYDFPDTVTSDADAIFDEIKSFGARILKINSSSSQSLSSSHSNLPNQRPTILAIFKSAGEAQKALESVTSPYYKLRVSQKSPTHFAGGDGSPIKN
ncbi:cAMP-regulated phosphoprotein 21-like isoform X3 [Hydractinia symbiolongicarpus]|uniref:cAMP-regulated phosphoprotein 21-like isoform X3 n=1 Tax=Hydractinia symbiolongicarpus TaxID=13093 RepID=UPI002551360B|nr:cAMP-regulated phosphoprotein 21-like isoform X3 [Hydractinia symbiolongicarpus]